MTDFHTVILRIVKHQTFEDLTARQLCVLCLVEKTPGTVRGLAADMAISKPAVSRAADRLEALGLLQRQDDPADRRSVLLVITPTGLTFLAAIVG